MRRSPAIFLDRDGTILNETGYLGDPNKMKFYRSAIVGLQRLSELKIPLIVISNQSGIARGYFTKGDFERVNRKFLSVLRRSGVRISGVYICPHLPSRGCSCRKPKIGLIRRAARERHLDVRRSFVIGDQARDVALARRAKSQGVLVLTGKGKYYRKEVERAGGHVASNLIVAAGWIARQLRGEKWAS